MQTCASPAIQVSSCCIEQLLQQQQQQQQQSVSLWVDISTLQLGLSEKFLFLRLLATGANTQSCASTNQ